MYKRVSITIKQLHGPVYNTRNC